MQQQTKHPWHNKLIKDQKRGIKNREKIWKKYKQDHQWHAYAKEKNIYNRLLIYHKKQTLLQKIKDSNKDTNKLFNLVSNLTNSKSGNPMQEDQTNDKLAEEFATFFLEKFHNICDKFTRIKEFKPSTNEQVPLLRKFSPLLCNEIHKEILSMNNKTCKLDHIPNEILKRILPAI